MANNNDQNAENRRFVAEILRQTANQYGRPGQRVGNRVGSFFANTVMASLGLRQAASSANVGQIPKASTYDMQVDELAKSFRLPGAEDALKQSGARAPRGMSLSEATTRAFIKTGEESGLTLEEIKKLLQESRSGKEHTDASGNITLERLTKSANDLYVKMREFYTVPDMAEKFKQIGTEQTRSARKERAREEYRNRPAPPPEVFEPTPFMNKILETANRVFGGAPVKRKFEYHAMRADGVEDKGEREAFSRKEVRDWIKSTERAPTFVREVGPATSEKESPLAKFMNTFANYMGVAQMTKADQELARENLTAAIDKLIESMDKNTKAKGGSKGDPAENPIKSWLKGHAAQAFEWAAPKVAQFAKPVVNAAQKVIPPGLMQHAQRWGANIVGQQAANLGVAPATAARFGAALGAAAGVAGVMVMAFQVTVKTVFAVISALNGMAKQALETTLRLSNYSGILAAAKAQLDVGRIHRDIASAHATAGSGAARLASENRYEEAMRPFADVMTEIGNTWGTVWANTGAAILEKLAVIIKLLEIAKKTVPDKDKHPFMNALARAVLGIPGEMLNQMNENAKAVPAGGVNQGWDGVNALDVQDMLRRQQGPRPPGMAVK